MISSNRPVLIRSEMMIGLLVAPVAPRARFLSTKPGSTLSSQSLVPVAISDLSDIVFFLSNDDLRTFPYLTIPAPMAISTPGGPSRLSRRGRRRQHRLQIILRYQLNMRVGEHRRDAPIPPGR